jgi:putative transcriptional regulator
MSHDATAAAATPAFLSGTGWHDVRMEGSLTARLLIAAPQLIDPNFAESVVLICRHDSEGALGLVLNRPTALPAKESLPGWAAAVADPDVVFLGGPVQIEMGVGLARLSKGEPPRPESDGWTPVEDRLGLIDLSLDPEREVESLESLRIFAGYSGWSEGQLEAEISSGSWFVAHAEPDDLFTQDPTALRRKVLRRQRSLLVLFADYPADPTLN